MLNVLRIKDKATFKDADGYSVKAFKLATGRYFAVHYNPAKGKIKFIDLFAIFDPASVKVEDLQNSSSNDIGVYLNNNDATEAFGDNIEVSVYLTEGVIDCFRIKNMDDPKVLEAFNNYVANHFNFLFLDEDLYAWIL